MKDMTRFLIVFTLLLSGLAMASKIHVEKVHEEEGDFYIEANLTATQATRVPFEIKDEVTGELFSLGKGEKAPVNLWVLVDASTMCQKKKVDVAVNRMIRKAKKHLHPSSLVSIVAYTHTTLEIHQNHKPVKEVKDYQVHCGQRSLSTSYEKPLRYLMKSQTVSDLPKVVWVYTGGNVRIGQSLLQRVKKTPMQLHLLLYNKHLAKEVIPTVKKTQRALGSKRVRFSMIDGKLDVIPEQRAQLRFTPPLRYEGKKAKLRLVATVDGKPITSSSVVLSIGKGGRRAVLRRYARVALGLVLLGLGGYLVYRVVRYYRPRKCKDCRQPLRHTDSQCPFCEQSGAYLVGAFTLNQKEKRGRQDILRLRSRGNEIGTHRRSRVHVLKGRNRRRSPYVRIDEHQLDNGAMAWYLTRLNAPEGVSLSVNSSPLKEGRYLCSGDTLNIDGLSLVFYIKESTENVA